MATQTVEQYNANYMMQNPQYGYTPPTSTASTTSTTQPGYWTEGKIVDGVNVGGGQFVQGQAPVNPTGTTVTATDIGNVKPMNISPAPTSTTAIGFNGELTSLAQSETESMDKEDALAAETEVARVKAESGKDSSKQGLMDFLGLRKGKATLENEAFSERNQLGTTVDETSNKVREVNNKILAIDISTNEQLKEFDKTFQGSPTGRNLARNSIISEAATAKADLYIEKLMAQQDYDSAKSIADRKVDMQMEQQQMTFDKLMFDYEENKDSFTKAEQREFELLADDRKRKLDAETETRKTFESTKIDLMRSANEQGAPQSVKDAIARAKTTEEAINAAGVYGGDIKARQIQQAQLDKLNAEANALKIQSITNPNASQYSTVLSTILGSGKFTKDQKADVIRAVNNGEDPFSVIKNQAKNLMGQNQANTVASYEIARDSLADIGNQLAAFYAAGGETGIMKGNFEKVIGKLGNVKNPELVNLATQIQGNLQVYRNAISGTAYSEQEGRDISSIFPGINKSETLNTAILTGRSRLFDTVIDSSYRTVLGGAYDELKKSQNVDNSQNDPLGLGISVSSNNSNPLGI